MLYQNYINALPHIILYYSLNKLYNYARAAILFYLEQFVLINAQITLLLLGIFKIAFCQSNCFLN